MLVDPDGGQLMIEQRLNSQNFLLHLFFHFLLLEPVKHYSQIVITLCFINVFAISRVGASLAES